MGPNHKTGNFSFLKQFSIGKRLYFAFGTLLVLMLITSGVALVELESTTTELLDSEKKYYPIAEDATAIDVELLTARRHEKDFIARQDPKYLKRMEETLSRLDTHIANVASSAKSLGITTIADDIAKLRTNRATYEQAFKKVADLIQAQGDKSSGIRGDLRGYAHKMESAIKETPSPMLMNALMVDYLMMRRHEKDFILRHDGKYVEKARNVASNFEDLDDDAIYTHATNYVDTLAKLAANVFAYEAQYPVMRKAAHEVETASQKIGKAVAGIIADRQAHVESLKHMTFWFVSGLSVVTFIIGVLLSFFSVRAITKPVTRIIAGLRDGSDQVASAASQVSGSSQQLAEGASEQAAAIEETSSSLEEMAAMTQQNADNAGQANGLMTDANQVVDQANSAMGQLTTSMEEISKASEETQKIVKTIDEIAFQTNLLALNAAVEAARAGEAGAGFAVVADEVRNLAMRAADAARDTAELIEATVKKIGDGSVMVTETNTAFAQVADSSRKVGELVSEIAAASSEQAQGIDQVNKAVTEMGQVTQQNAASAEESASASEEMSAQAEQMQEFVGDLVVLVEGNRKATRPIERSGTHETALVARTSDTSAKAVPAPAQVIPLDGKDTFGDF